MPPDDLSTEEQALLDADRQAGGLPEDDPAAQTQDDGAAPPAGEAAATEQQPARQQMVPHAALHEERELRKGKERELAEERRTKQVLEERFNIMLQRFGQPQPAPAQQQAPTIPQFDVDPVGNLRATQQQQNAILGEIVQAVIGQQQQNQVAAGASQLQQRAAMMEREFSAATPDYDKASKHLFDARREELVTAGWSDPGEIHQIMVSEANGLAAQAIRQGKNPAEVVYALAKIRGYQTPTAEAATAAAQTGEDRVQTIARGQQQGRGVGALHGTGPANVTAQSVANMSQSEFDAFLSKASPDQLSEVFGA